MSPEEERQLLAVARDAAEAAAAELRQRFGEQARGVRSKSTPMVGLDQMSSASSRCVAISVKSAGNWSGLSNPT